MSEQLSPPPPQTYEALPTREGYDRWAEIYDAEDNPLIALEQPRVDELLGDVRGLELIDVGCGTGRHAVRLAAKGARVTAVDFSEGMMERIKGKPGWENIRRVHHDLAKPLPVPAASFDRVLCALVLDHISDPAGLFGDFRRVCKPGGAIVVSVMHPAMMLRGIQARFTDPATGRETRPASHANQLSDYVMAAICSGLKIDHVSEHVMNAELALKSPRAAKYVDWPMLLMMRMRP